MSHTQDTFIMDTYGRFGVVGSNPASLKLCIYSNSLQQYDWEQNPGCTVSTNMTVLINVSKKLQNVQLY